MADVIEMNKNEQVTITPFKLVHTMTRALGKMHKHFSGEEHAEIRQLTKEALVTLQKLEKILSQYPLGGI